MSVLGEWMAERPGLKSMTHNRVLRQKKARATPELSLDGSACWARTSDPLINSQLLYQLS